MKNFLYTTLWQINKIIPCFTVQQNQSTLKIKLGINNKSYFENTTINLDILPTIPKVVNPTIEQPSPINSLTSSLKKEFFLNNSLEAEHNYKNMLDNFINHHGKDSLKIKELILEQDIADRIYNIHVITGNNLRPNLLKYLKEMDFENNTILSNSLALEEIDISSITPTCGHSLFNSSNASSITVELSPLGESLDITSLPDIITYASTTFGG
jgi:hypothetical protein